MIGGAILAGEPSPGELKVINQHLTVLRPGKPKPAVDEWAWVKKVCGLHVKQLRFVTHPAKRKIACAGRQSAKSTAAAIAVVDTLTKNVGQGLWVGLSKNAVERTVWPEFRRLLKEWQLWDECEISKAQLSVTFPNGSTLFLVGTDDSEHMESFRGSTNLICVLDEIGAQAYDLIEQLVEEILEPSLLKAQGPLICIGTPPPKKVGWFSTTWHDALSYDRDDDGWFKSTWTGEDNPYIPDFLGQVQRIAKRRGVDWRDDPKIRREYFAEWIEDDTNSVCFFDDAKNYIDGAAWKSPLASQARVDMAKLPGGVWRYVCGIDPAMTDSYSIQIIGVTDLQPEHYYQIAEWQAPRNANSPTDVIAKVLLDYRAEFGSMRTFVDPGGGKTLVADMQSRHGVHLELALRKQERMAQIERINNALVASRMHIIRGSKLAEDMKLAQWKERTDPGRFREYNVKLHKIDALDAFRYGLVGLWEAAPDVPELRTADQIAKDQRTAVVVAEFEDDEARANDDGLDGEMGYQH